MALFFRYCALNTCLVFEYVAMALAACFTSEIAYHWLMTCNPSPTASPPPPAGHLPLYWKQKDFTQYFLKFHEKKGQAVLRVSLPHKWMIIVADPAITAGILGAEQQ